MCIPKIYLLYGTIASGKSTYAKNAANAGFITINDDNIVTLLHGGDYSLYDKQLKTLYKSIENHILYTSIMANKSVVIDKGTLISRHARSRFISIANSLDILCDVITFPQYDAKTHALRRYNSDSRGCTLEQWEKTAQFHIKNAEYPCLSEGINQVHSFKNFEQIQTGLVFV